MEFETHYRIFVVFLILGIAFYVISYAYSDYVLEVGSFTFNVMDTLFLFTLAKRAIIYTAIFFLSLFLLGIGSIIPKLEGVHLKYAHLTLIIVFAIYGIYLTANNLYFYYTSKSLISLLPFYIPEYIWNFKTRHVALAIPVIIALIKDLVSLR